MIAVRAACKFWIQQDCALSLFRAAINEVYIHMIYVNAHLYMYYLKNS